MGHSHSSSRHILPRRLRSNSARSSSLTSSSTHFDALPSLIIECVCQHLCWHCLNRYAPARRLSNTEEQIRRSGVETLYRLCLVSRAVRDVAQSILFHRFRGIRAAQIAKFTLVLQLRPDLAAAVRTVQLDLISSNEDLVVDLLNQLPGLRSMEILHAPRAWTFANLRDKGLPHLELLCVRFFGPSERIALLRAVPNLRELVVWSANPGVKPDELDEGGTLPMGRSVKTLKLVNCFPAERGTGYRDFKSLVGLCENLVEFELVEAVGRPGRMSGPTAREVITMLTPRWNSLRHLRLVGYGHDLEHNTGGDIEPISSLAEFPALVSVEVPTVVIYGSGARRQPLKRLSAPDFLPPGIVTLTLGWFWELDVDVLPVDLLQLVGMVGGKQEGGGRFRSLKTVRLESQTTKQVVRRLPGFDELRRAFNEVDVELELVQ